MMNQTTASEKRVVTLYRVSTKKQVAKKQDSDDADIPVQEKFCRNFIDQNPGWVLVREFVEAGVSGFKVSAKDRDAIQDIQRMAAKKEFDVLLVFMFDRIGRIDDETPFIVEWFVKNGIEVWSANEGEQRFDNHVDKLLNYIRYWQASGESVKTSIRTKVSLDQVVQEGHFRGGSVPYGYKMVKQGRINKRGYEVNEIAIDEEQAAVIKLVYELYLEQGLGTKRICTYLEKNGIRNAEGTNFVNCTIYRFLKNEAYTGRLKNGDTLTDIFPELQIIPPETFQRVQNQMAERSAAQKLEGSRSVPLRTNTQGLLCGKLICGHCGGRMIQTTNKKTHIKADGTPGNVYYRVRYTCYNRTRHSHLCDGQTGYTVHIADDIVGHIIHDLFDRAKDAPKDQIALQHYSNKVKMLEGQLKTSSAALAKHQKDYDTLKAEMISVIRGDSALDRDSLNELMAESKAAIARAQEEVTALSTKLGQGQALQDSIRSAHNELLSWADIYDESEHAVKMMILSKIIDQVRISRDYKLDIDFNISYQDYFGGGGQATSA